MRELNKSELDIVTGGMSDFDIFSLSVMGGTLLGSGLGIYIAFSVPVLNIQQLFLFPIFMVAGAGFGGIVGSLFGTITGVGGICAHHLCEA